MSRKRYSEWRSRGIIRSAQSKMRSNTMLSCLRAFAYAGCTSRSTVPLSYWPALTYPSDLSLVIPLLLHLLSHFDTARRFTLRSIMGTNVACLAQCISSHAHPQWTRPPRSLPTHPKTPRGKSDSHFSPQDALPASRLWTHAAHFGLLLLGLVCVSSTCGAPCSTLFSPFAVYVVWGLSFSLVIYLFRRR